jgi:Tfp pilus assembly protein FimT
MELTELIVPVFILAIGACLGYYTRQMLAAKRAGTIEKNIANKLAKAKAEAAKVSEEAQTKAQKLLESTRQETQTRSRELAKTETLILKRESTLEQKIVQFDADEKEFQEKVKKTC